MGLRGCKTVDVADACDELGVPAVRTGALGPVRRTGAALTGSIATIGFDFVPDADVDPIPDILHAMAGLAGQVLLTDVQGREDQQCWGGVLTACAMRYGLLGAVINGAVRDVDSIVATDFPVFARGVHPSRIRGRLRMRGCGVPVRFDDGWVRPGDSVIADSDGVLFLPAESADAVGSLARERAEAERGLMARLASGADPRDVFPRR